MSMTSVYWCYGTQFTFGATRCSHLVLCRFSHIHHHGMLLMFVVVSLPITCASLRVNHCVLSIDSPLRGSWYDSVVFLRRLCTGPIRVFLRRCVLVFLRCFSDELCGVLLNRPCVRGCVWWRLSMVLTSNIMNSCCSTGDGVFRN